MSTWSDMLTFVTKWYDGPLELSKEGYDGYGILGMLGGIILRSLPSANLLEIGIGRSSIYMSRLANKYNRKYYCCDVDAEKVKAIVAVPGFFQSSDIVFTGTSDNFLIPINFENIGLVFIDGDHHYEQVKKDFDTIFSMLLENGYIFLHDTYPPTEDMIAETFCGSAYKLKQELKEREDLECFTFNKILGYGFGITMVRKIPKDLPYYQR